ncbi:MAG TPA: hypothetical protein VLA12_15070, partial [Planctomycetaceae bacterium]|nr:hypothetical protein [Planctomycetaceae bacterium]
MFRLDKASVAACLLLSVAGCNATHNGIEHDELRAFRPEPARVVSLGDSDSALPAEPSQKTRDLTGVVAASRKPVGPQRNESRSTHSRNGDTSHVKIVGYHNKPAPEKLNSNDATLHVDGKPDRSQLVSDLETSRTLQTVAGEESNAPMLLPSPVSQYPAVDRPLVELTDISFEDTERFPLDLPSALRMVGGQHPVVGFAQWRVQEAYAQLDRAEVLWLPSLQAGFNYRRRDGNYQDVSGNVVDVNLNSFQYGLGAGGVGAGTPSRPGLVAQFHLADAIFQPEIAQKNAWGRGHAADAAENNQLLEAALAYINLLEAEQDRRIVEDTLDLTQDLAKLTSDYAASGQGLQSDADRLVTELKLVGSRMAEANERADVASSRLARALSIDAGQRIVPVDPTVVPIDLVPLGNEKGSLISTGLSNRPELKEAQNLVAAACDEYKRQKYAPLVPSVLLGFTTASFGGGLGGDLDNFGGRYDFDALMMWEVRNLGFGEKAARRE